MTVLFGSSREEGLLAASQSKLLVHLGSGRPSLPLGVVGQCYYRERAKHPLAAGRELAWHSQLSLGVLLLNRNNFMEYHPQTRPLCKQQPKNPPNQQTNKQKQPKPHNHSAIMSEHSQKYILRITKTIKHPLSRFMCVTTSFFTSSAFSLPSCPLDALHQDAQ